MWLKLGNVLYNGALISKIEIVTAGESDYIVKVYHPGFTDGSSNIVAEETLDAALTVANEIAAGVWVSS